MKHPLLHGQTGFTLIELVVALVIISMAAATIVGTMSSVATRSAENMQRTQAGDIAAAYLKEIMSQPFADPAGGDGEANRPLFDDADDYNLLDETGVRDRSGVAISSLDEYRAQAFVTNSFFNGIPAADCLRIDVRVTTPGGFVVELTAYKTKPPP